jgi:nucleotide-binding universal stress UspA family protein
METLRFIGGSGALGDAICNRAAEVDADEVIVGSRGLTPMSR